MSIYNNDLYHYIFNLIDNQLDKRDTINEIADRYSVSKTRAVLIYNEIKHSESELGDHTIQ
mgnify:CR=1 FL=1